MNKMTRLMFLFAIILAAFMLFMVIGADESEAAIIDKGDTFTKTPDVGEQATWEFDLEVEANWANGGNDPYWTVTVPRGDDDFASWQHGVDPWTVPQTADGNDPGYVAVSGDKSAFATVTIINDANMDPRVIKITYTGTYPVIGDVLTVGYGDISVSNSGKAKAQYHEEDSVEFATEMDSDGDGTLSGADPDETISYTDPIGYVNVDVKGKGVDQYIVVLPGETFAGDYYGSTETTGTSDDQYAGVAFEVEIYAVDEYWNIDTNYWYPSGRNLVFSDPLVSPNGDPPTAEDRFGVDQVFDQSPLPTGSFMFFLGRAYDFDDVPTSGEFGIPVTLYNAETDETITVEEWGGFYTDSSSYFDVLGGSTTASVDVDPDTATINADQDQAYTISAIDAYGNNLGDVTAEPTVTWEIVEAGHGGSWGGVNGATYDPYTVGSWTVRGGYGGQTDDVSLTVTVGAEDYVTITGHPDGAEINTETRTTDENAIGYYASAYDAYGNYIGLASGDWSWTGDTIGIITGTPGTSGVVDYTTVGSATLDFVGTNSDTTGLITVGVGAADHVVITDTAGGTEVTTESRDTDENAVGYYASMYDADGNYISLDTGAWSWTGDAIGVITGSPATDVSVDYTLVGSATLDFVGTYSDTTGLITVGPGAEASVIITDSPDGTEVTTESRTTDENSVGYYASGYDADGNYIGLTPGDWTWTGDTIGSMTGTPGTTLSVAYTTVGSATLDFVGLYSDTTGLITVGVGVEDHVTITEMPGMFEVLTESWTTDDNTVPYYASAYDADDNYIGLVSGDWTWTGVTIGDITGTPGTGVSVDFTTPGAATLDFAGTNSDTTGTITVTVGHEASVVITDAPDGAEVTTESWTTDDGSTYYASAYDADGNYVGLTSGDWTWTGVTIGTITGTPGDTVTVDFTAPGVATLDFTNGFSDTTGDITVGVGVEASVIITNSPDGTEVTTESRTTDENSVGYYASGYDADGNYVGLTPGDWTWTGDTIGSMTGTPGTTLSVAYSLVGSATLDFVGLYSDTTDLITVTAGAEASVVITDAPDGTEVTTESHTTDDNAEMYYASAYDADGNYVGLTSGIWTWTGTTIGVITGTPGDTATVDYTTPGLATLDFTNGFSDTTGDITVTEGAPASVVITDSPGGTEVTTESRTTDENAVTYYASAYDADGNYVGLATGSWSWTGDTIGSITGSPGNFVTVDYDTVGSATLDFVGTFSDTTGLITVGVGAESYVLITWSPDGMEVPTDSHTTDVNAYPYYASAYDDDGNYIGLVSGDWSWTGVTVGVITGTPGTDVLIDFTTPGVAQLNFVGTNSDSTGDITVTVGAEASVVITDAPNGAEVTTESWTTDDGSMYYASAYDADGNYVGPAVGDWSWTGDTIGLIIGSPAADVLVDYTTPGVATLDFLGSFSDTTGDITVTVGAEDYVTITDAPNGMVVTTESWTTDDGSSYYGSAYDADDNYIGLAPGSWFWTGDLIGTVTGSPGTDISVDYVLVGSAVLEFTGTHNDATGTITVTVGVQASVVITESADGPEVTTESWTTDDNAVPYYASAYDADGNYIGLTSGTWSWTGVLIGSIGGTPGDTVTVDYDFPGVATLDFTNGFSDTTGDITVTVGAEASVVITDMPDGTEVTTESRTTDENMVGYYASAYDADSNYIGLTSGDWSWTGDLIGVITGTPGDSVTVDYTLVGAATLDFVGTFSDTTDTITVTHGVATSVEIAPDHDSVVSGFTKVYSMTAYDADGNSWSVTADSYTIDVGAGGTWMPTDTYTAAIAGLWTVTGYYGLLDDDTSLTVVAGDHHHYELSAVSPQTILTPFTLTITAVDIAGNTVTTIDTTLEGYTYTLGVDIGLIDPTNPGVLDFTDGVATTTITLTGVGLITIDIEDDQSPTPMVGDGTVTVVYDQGTMPQVMEQHMTIALNDWSMHVVEIDIDLTVYELGYMYYCQNKYWSEYFYFFIVWYEYGYGWHELVIDNTLLETDGTYWTYGYGSTYELDVGDVLYFYAGHTVVPAGTPSASLTLVGDSPTSSDQYWEVYDGWNLVGISTLSSTVNINTMDSFFHGVSTDDPDVIAMVYVTDAFGYADAETSVGISITRVDEYPLLSGTYWYSGRAVWLYYQGASGTLIYSPYV